MHKDDRYAVSETETKRKTLGTSDLLVPSVFLLDGGGYGIRTREGFNTQHDFQSCALGRSANPPQQRLQDDLRTLGMGCSLWAHYLVSHGACCGCPISR